MIRIIIPYFGQWPEWMPLFLASCKDQERFEWLLIGDVALTEQLPPNVQLVNMNLGEVLSRIEQVGLSRPEEFPAYKLCDYKPAYGLIFQDLIAGSEYWGHGDLDVAYGDLSTIPLEFDVFSADDRSCGHFQLYRNVVEVNQLFLSMPRLDEYLRLSSTVGIDEPQMTHVLDVVQRTAGIHWVRAESRQLELAKKTPLMGATIEPNGQLVGQASVREARYSWTHQCAEQNGSDLTGSKSFLYLHWFQWKTASVWKMKMQEWDEQLVLAPDEWESGHHNTRPSSKR